MDKCIKLTLNFYLDCIVHFLVQMKKVLSNYFLIWILGRSISKPHPFTWAWYIELDKPHWWHNILHMSNDLITCILKLRLHPYTGRHISLAIRRCNKKCFACRFLEKKNKYCFYTFYRYTFVAVIYLFTGH